MFSAIDVSFAYGWPERRVRPLKGWGIRPRLSRAGSIAPVVLDRVSLDIPAGSFVGVLGPNGSGKTTLLRLLAGMLRPTSGRVQFEGRDLASIPRTAVARAIAVVPQETHPAFEYSVLEMVLMGRYPHLGALAVEGPDDLRIARDAMARTGTAALESRRFDTLSGGEKQRVVIASALAQSGRVLLLDEPTSSLDLSYQLEIAAVVSRLNREDGTTIVLTTHDLNFAASICRTLVLLREGRVIAAGPTSDVLTPANVRAVYAVDADIAMHERAGHLAVLPIRLARNGGTEVPLGRGQARGSPGVDDDSRSSSRRPDREPPGGSSVGPAERSRR